MEAVKLTNPFAQFDLDLVQLAPELETVFADDRDCWTFGRTKDGQVFNSLVFWHGPGCIVLSQTDEVREERRKTPGQPSTTFYPKPRNQNLPGYYKYHGFITDDSLIRTGLSDVLRYLWVQDYAAVIDGQPWVTLPHWLNRSHSAILYHLRGWQLDPQVDVRIGQVVQWARYSMETGRKLLDTKKVEVAVHV